MHINHFKYLIHIAKTGSISQSADYFYITPQGLSQAIHQFERELGVELLNRNGNKISLTIAGQKTVVRAEELFIIYNQLITDLEPFKPKTEQGYLNIFTTMFICGTVLPLAIRRFYKKFPYVKVTINEKIHSEIIGQVKNSQNCIGIQGFPDYVFDCSGRLPDQDVSFEILHESEFCACMAKTFPLANRKQICIEELSSYPLVLFNFDHNKDGRKIFKNSEKPYIIQNTSNLNLFKETIARGSAIGLSQKLIEKFYKTEGTVTIPIVNSYKLIYGSITPRNQPVSPFVEYFLQMLKEAFDA
ncbi:LysR family transcriptional regulator [Desulfosporosinus fructosivorans]|uniref:LysR family transcriptional regulator n=1 Tax=Desulfosporosinus fructosivorans TaxID=2018669 RepID=A0A4Z0QXT3_9FIRM|nr:LysR family transcriptional regulator [Desulfosporosinus fructosivorans]TGE35109.1 LysR family transcriptional regulator [Desulfosporosinus fructosivorans]